MELAVSVIDMHAGGPAVMVGPGATACQAPAPALAAGLNQSNPVPAPMLQSVIDIEPKALPDDNATSK
jgi:hypothetical protein